MDWRIKGAIQKVLGVVPGGADWQFVQPDGLTEADARYVLEADSGEIIAVKNRGLRDAPPAIMQKLLAGEPAP